MSHADRADVSSTSVPHATAICAASAGSAAYGTHSTAGTPSAPADTGTMPDMTSARRPLDATIRPNRTEGTIPDIRL
ncbi:hypothetical protein LEP48_16325 [Isoptericola sp. NEAU-Y5]|uniref:Uncharacterized protein n=1 Tax=Isoptericola luteus TaxID=2879484 RepID=A0ABS7ZLZ8_9MICO|nr:hypothetical protein [Isoptericola sp. NEAU-Y5]